MENNQQNNPNKQPFKDTKKRKGLTQKRTIFQYLKNNIATASMVTAATGISQKNICRYKRDLEKAGLLWEIEKKICKCTGFRAWYLTTNPEISPLNNQLNLF